MYHSQFNAKAKGTAIVVHKDIPFQTEEVIAGKNGRFAIVSGRLFTWFLAGPESAAVTIQPLGNINVMAVYPIYVETF